MDLEYKNYIERAENEIELAKVIVDISINDEKKEEFNLSKNSTFYSAVISHSYYSIFYTAKSYLLYKWIKTKAPKEHKKTYEEFKKLTDKGEIDLELLNFYSELLIKTNDLLGIFKIEKRKRGNFTYQKLNEANKNPAEKSLSNAKIFFKNIYNLLN